MNLARPEPARPFFLQRGSRQLFCLHHAPAGASRGAVVHVPAFAEEMNKSRRMASLQARALAAQGWHVLQLDFLGTGDSEGDFGDATWADWMDDVAEARRWLAAAAGHEPWLWGLRLGALLASASVQARAAPGLLLWQPVLSGKQHLQQFLRLKAGAEWLAAGREAEAQAKPMEQLTAGQTVEVAGYALNPALALPIAAATLVLPPGLARLVWFEVSPRADATLAPASVRVLAPWREGGRLTAAMVQGSSFWQALEIETVPALVDAGVQAMSS